MRDPLRTKPEMYDAWIAGRLGNRPRIWTSMEELFSSGYRGKVWVRDRCRCDSSAFIGEISQEELAEALSHFPSSPHCLVFGEIVPDEHRIFQGEVARLAGGLYLRWTDVRRPLREALAIRQNHAFGLSAKLLLQRYLDPPSYEDLLDLLDEYPDHVVEFSTFDVGVGENATRNTVFWEVRLY